MIASFFPSAWRWMADGIETVFGPDPGLLRLRTATRAVICIVTTIGIAVVLFGATMKTSPAFAAGFIISIFGNVAVRDRRDFDKAITLALLAGTITLTMGATGAVATHAWLAEAFIFLVCVGASLAKMAGPRGMAIGMIAFMGAFIGDLLKASPVAFPEILATAAIGALIVAGLRFWLMRDDPAALLERVRHHFNRRISRIIQAVRELIADTADGNPPDVSESTESLLNREIGRLNDALLVAQNELTDIERLPNNKQHLNWDSFVGLQLSAERLVRVAVRYGAQKNTAIASERLGHLNAALINGSSLPTRSGASESPLLRSIDALIVSLDRLAGSGGSDKSIANNDEAIAR